MEVMEIRSMKSMVQILCSNVMTGTEASTPYAMCAWEFMF